MDRYRPGLQDDIIALPRLLVGPLATDVDGAVDGRNLEAGPDEGRQYGLDLFTLRYAATGCDDLALRVEGVGLGAEAQCGAVAFVAGREERVEPRGLPRQGYHDAAGELVERTCMAHLRALDGLLEGREGAVARDPALLLHDGHREGAHALPRASSIRWLILSPSW